MTTTNQTAKQVCEIINEQFSWVMKVDGQVIPFNGFDVADYFEGLYTKLGYEVKRIDNSL